MSHALRRFWPGRRRRDSEVIPRTGDRYRDRRPDAWQLGYATLLLGLGVAPLLMQLKLQVALAVVGLLLITAATVRWPNLQPTRWMLFALTLLGGLNVVDAYQSVVGQSAGSAFLLTMVALKRLETRTRRDLRVFVVAFGFLLVVQFLFGESPWLAAWMVLMLVGAVTLLADLDVAERPGQRLAQWRRAGRLALLLTTQAVPLALVLFVFFPRLDAPLWELRLGDETAVTGLKDWLEPGSIGELVVSGEDAFRVRFDAPPPLSVDEMYWRGPVLWQTTGRRWLPLPDNPLHPSRQPEAMPVRALLGEPIGYRVVLEPTDQRWLFALELPTTLPKQSRLTTDFQLLAAKPVSDLRLYRVSSVTDYRLSKLSPAHRRASLQLPPAITTRMRELVDGWRAKADSPAEVVRRALTYFNQAPFRYTLLPPTLGSNPADEFLFETKAGFCEHYASSFVLLMRLAEIPSRIVLGYLGGEYNPLSGDYLVRQSDAHAWAEVWLDDRGWTRIDPTAAIAAERVERDPRLSALGSSAPVRFRVDEASALGRLVRGARFLAGAFDANWKNWVVGFSSRDQQRLLDRLGLGPLQEYGLAMLMAVGSSAVLLGWWISLTRRRGEQDPIQRCWRRFGRRLARIGLAPGHHEGPLNYRKRVLHRRPDLATPVNEIVEIYLRLRFQPHHDATDRRGLCSKVRRFRPRRRSAQPRS